MTLTADAFGYVAALVRRESAIVLEPGKEYLVEARLLPLARAGGARDVGDYVSRVRATGTATERFAVVEALTTNETSWFRDQEPFDVLVRDIVPGLLEQTRHRRKISVWSAACSSGQEAYTIAMLMAQHVVPLGWQVEILATDIASGMLDRTRQARYTQLEINRGLPAPMLVRHFQRSGTQWQVDDDLMSMVRVQHLNLAAPFPPLPVFDVVFLRNVLIYFDSATKRAVLERVRQVMAPSGYLFLGGAETTLGIDESWHRTPLGRCTVNRPSAPSSPSAPSASVAPVARSVGTATGKVV